MLAAVEVMVMVVVAQAVQEVVELAQPEQLVVLIEMELLTEAVVAAAVLV
jgi:hypothetical protein